MNRGSNFETSGATTLRLCNGHDTLLQSAFSTLELENPAFLQFNWKSHPSQVGRKLIFCNRHTSDPDSVAAEIAEEGRDWLAMQELVEILSGDDSNPVVDEQVLVAFLDEFGAGERLNGLRRGWFWFKQLRKDERRVGQIRIFPVLPIEMAKHQFPIIGIADTNLSRRVMVSTVNPNSISYSAQFLSGEVIVHCADDNPAAVPLEVLFGVQRFSDTDRV